MASFERPIHFGSYLLLDRVRIGGMAEVWRASRVLPTGARELVALKRALPTVAEDPDLAALFDREIAIALSLDHPNIVRALDAGRIGSRAFLAMEYLAGPDLRDLLLAARHSGISLPPGLACHLVASLCRALAYLHARGLAHGDLSAENCVLSFDGDLKLVDFGIARRGDAGSDLRTAALLLVELASGMRPTDPSRLPALAPPALAPPALGKLAARALSTDGSAQSLDALALASALGDLEDDCAFGRADAAHLIRTLFAARYDEERLFHSQPAAGDSARESGIAVETTDT